MSNGYEHIAHRGDMLNFPENTLPAIEAALQYRITNIEFDIQLSKDEVPFLFHDSTLDRVTEESGSFFTRTSLELQQIQVAASVGESRASLVSLEDLVQYLNSQEESVTAFVEIKGESVDHFGVKLVVTRVLDILKQATFPFVILSYRAEVLRELSSDMNLSLGWVLTHYDEDSMSLAQKLQPDFLFCSKRKLPLEGPLWSGSWEWVVYDIREKEVAEELSQRGVRYIETGDVVKMGTRNDNE